MKQTSSSKHSASDDAPELRREDLDRARLQVGGNTATPNEFVKAAKEALGKQRVSIMLDGEIIAYFKSRAGERGYQTLINQALREAMRDDEMEAILRRVIREELRTPT